MHIIRKAETPAQGESSSRSGRVPTLFNESDIRGTIHSTIDSLGSSLRKVNTQIHSHPELAYEEVIAHKTLTDFLESQGFQVQRQAWGLDTSFEATIGQGGRQVVFCAEYDALPGIGHACGHNLIATASLAAFLGAAQVLKKLDIPGRLRLLGTPAEERGGGKIDLIKNGAFDPPEDVAAAIMAHPMDSGQDHDGKVLDGIGGMSSKAILELVVEFHGRSSHASAAPWNGVNALDAAVAAYNNVSMLRQQISTDDRVSGVFEVGGTVPNVITDYTRMRWNVRSQTLETLDPLVKRVRACLDAGAASAGCTINYELTEPYIDLRPIPTLCTAYAEEMTLLGKNVIPSTPPSSAAASTDMGNVSHHVVSFHGAFAIPTEKNVNPHNPGFAASAGTEEAHENALKCAKGMAMLAIRTLTDDGFAKAARVEFEEYGS